MTKQIDSHLITDYRSVRGCEVEHCVLFMNPNQDYENHTLIEIITRSISKLNIFVYPYIKTIEERPEKATCLSNILWSWNEEEKENIDEVKIHIDQKKCGYTICIGGESVHLRIQKSELQTFQEVHRSILCLLYTSPSPRDS